MPGYIRSP